MDTNIPPEQLTKKQLKALKRQEKLSSQEHQERTRKMKRIGLWLLVVVGIVGSIWGLMKLGASRPTTGSMLTDAVTDSDWSEGNKDAKVTLVEYSDFQCPACGAYFPTVKKIQEDLGDKVRLVYRHFPLPQHQNAWLAAQAAEAAGKQGKFWEMHDMLFDRQDRWGENSGARDLIIGYADELKLDKNKFIADLDSDAAKKKISNDQDSGTRSGVNATPTFFLNGEQLAGLNTFDDLRRVVVEAIKATANGN